MASVPSHLTEKTPKAPRTPSTPGQCVKRGIETTSVRGVTRALKEPVKCLKFTWFFFIALFFVLLLYSIYSEVAAYLRFETAVRISADTVPQGPSDFVVCNKNPVVTYRSVSGVQTFEEYKEMVKTKFAGSLKPEALAHLMSYEGYFENVGIETAQRISHLYKDLVLDCTVRGRDGPSAEYNAGDCGDVYTIRTVTHEKYFNCFSFRLKVNSNVGVAGVKMMVHLDTKQQEIRIDGDPEKNYGSGSGLILALIHSDDLENAWTEEVSVEISSGTHAKLDVKPALRRKLTPPYGLCKAYEPSDNAILCRIRCLRNATLQKCNCDAYQSHRLNPTLFRDPCGKLQDDDKNTSLRAECLMDVYGTQLDVCSCPEHCDTYTPSIVVSSSSWPQPEQQLLFYQDQIRPKPFRDKYIAYESIIAQVQAGQQADARLALQQTSLIAQNFAMLDIRFRNTLQITEDIPRTSLFNVCARIGGNMNLFSGISLLIFMEIVDLVVKICIAMRAKKGVNKPHQLEHIARQT
jgi:hypothetical protein